MLRCTYFFSDVKHPMIDSVLYQAVQEVTAMMWLVIAVVIPYHILLQTVLAYVSCPVLIIHSIPFILKNVKMG